MLSNVTWNLFNKYSYKYLSRFVKNIIISIIAKLSIRKPESSYFSILLALMKISAYVRIESFAITSIYTWCKF
jgi:hypothetical protein